MGNLEEKTGPVKYGFFDLFFPLGPAFRLLEILREEDTLSRYMETGVNAILTFMNITMYSSLYQIITYQ